MQSIEILPIALQDGGLVSLRPDCADSFVVGWPVGAKPEEVATKAVATLGLTTRVLHSTSWRHSGDEVVLTYLAVVSPAFKLPESWEIETVMRTDLARGGRTAPPAVIGVDQVLEHALRHLAWLLKDDAVIRSELPNWTDVLRGYAPEPFRALGGPVQ